MNANIDSEERLDEMLRNAFVILSPDDVIRPGDVYPVCDRDNSVKLIPVGHSGSFAGMCVFQLPQGIYLRPA